MDKALGFAVRGRGNHDILPLALQLMWSKKELQTARIAAEEAQSVDELSFATRTACKAGSVLAHFDNDVGAGKLMRAYVLALPLQTYINKVMQADKAVGLLCNAESVGASNDVIASLALECQRLNMAFVAGINGRAVVEAYTDMIVDFSDHRWHTPRMPEAYKLQTALSATRSLMSAWRRLVFYFEDARFQLFKACTPDQGDSFTYDSAHVDSTMTSVQQRFSSCPACLDSSFAQEMLRMWSRYALHAYQMLSGIRQHMCIGSGVVERVHLLGQELKPAKSRGVAVCARVLGERTYIKSAVQERKQKRDLVHEHVLGQYGISLKRFHAMSRAFRLGGARRKTQTSAGSLKVASALDAKQKGKRKRKAAAFGCFQTEKWLVKAKVGTAAFLAEKRRIAGLWATLSEDDKFMYEVLAEARQSIAHDAIGDLTADSINNVVASISKHQTRQLNQLMFLRAVDAINEHKAWSAGLGLGTAWSALKPEKVLLAGTDIDAAQELAHYFAYDDRVTDNPAGTAKPIRSCCARTWGVCSQDSLIGPAMCGPFNIYARLSGWQVTRSNMPFVTKLSTGATAAYYLLVDIIGKGDTALLIGLQSVDDLASILRLKVAKVDGTRQAACCTSQMALCSLLKMSSSSDLPGQDIQEMGFSVVAFDLIVHNGGLAFKLDKVLHDSMLSLHSRIKLSAAAKQKEGSTTSPCFMMPFGIQAPTASGCVSYADFTFLDDDDCGVTPARSQKRQTLVEGCFADSDHEVGEASSEKEKALDHCLEQIPAGECLGIVGYEVAPTGRSKCFCCVSMQKPAAECMVPKGSLKFLFRQKRGKLELSLHPACVLNGSMLLHCTGSHLQQTCKFFSDTIAGLSKDDPTLHLMMQCSGKLIAASIATASASSACS